MKVVLTGDCLFSSKNIANRIDPRIVEDLRSADAAFTNAEFSTPKRTSYPGLCMYLTSVPQDTLDEFNDLNIRMVGFANNHTTDYGPQGAVDTIEAAEARKIIPCGVGRNLKEARKARFLDTNNGRVGVVACCSTWSERSLASEPGPETVARPGLSPLRWGQTYVLPEKEFEQLKEIDRILGTKESMDEVGRIETWPTLPDGQFKFGSAMQGNLMIQRGEKAEVKTYVNEGDEKALLKCIADADNRSHFVIASLHSHEGLNENWYGIYPPEFVEQYAHDAIDAGADVFVCHGAHFSRGVEIYKGHPIFYNLGSLIMEFEAGNSMISPEMYKTYYLDPNEAQPSDLHRGRAKDKDGNWQGFYSERRFSKNFYVRADVEEKGTVNYTIVPLDLDMRREDCLKRGLPQIADDQVGREIAEDLTRMSEKYGTQFSYCETDGTIQIIMN